MTSRVATALATVPQPCRVLGTSLRPFCLGHHLLFRRLGLPFAMDEKAEAEPDEILIGIAICAGSYEETLAAMLDGTWLGIVRDWRRRVEGFWLWPRTRDLKRAERLFRRYLATGYEEPPLWRHKGGAAVEMTAPWEQLLKVRLMMAGFSESDVLNGYLPQRWYDYFTAIELEQASKLTADGVKAWRPTFYTPQHAANLEAVQQKANA